MNLIRKYFQKNFISDSDGFHKFLEVNAPLQH